MVTIEITEKERTLLLEALYKLEATIPFVSLADTSKVQAERLIKVMAINSLILTLLPEE